MNPNHEISITELALCTGLTANHIVQLCKRGILPKGRKGLGDDWKCRYLPFKECMRIINAHQPGMPWRTRKQETQPRLNWKKLG